MLVVDNLHVHYGKVYALQGVSLRVDKGETVAVLGANGAGKSTLLNTIVGILKPTTGDIILQGEHVAGIPAHKMGTRGVGYVPEGRRVFGDMTVYENLIVGAYSVADADQRQRNLAAVYQLFPLIEERKRQVAGTLSGGEQQMLAIGRALMSSPTLLLLDEPSLGLAPIIIQDIFRTLQEINENGTTVLLVEQSANLALKVAHRAYVLESGHITGEGTSAELARNGTIEMAYLGD